MRRTTASRTRSTKRRPRTTSRASSNGRGHNGRPASQLSRGWLDQFLVEMHTTEQGGVELYEKALKELEHEKHQPLLEKYLQQTHRHVALCEELLEVASVGRDASAPGSEAVEHKAHGLISTKVPEHLNDLNNFENLVLAETKDHWNWEMLSSVVDEIPDLKLKRAAKRAVREVLKQEVDHLKKMEAAVTAIATQMAHEPTPEERESAEDEEPGEARYDE